MVARRRRRVRAARGAVRVKNGRAGGILIGPPRLAPGAPRPAVPARQPSPMMTSSADPAAAAPPRSDAARGLQRLAIVLIALMVVVILMGAMTTSTGSGLAFLDWPLSDGALMPERSYTTLPGFFEHFHRVAGACAGVLAVWLAVAAAWRCGARSPAARVTQAGLLLIVLQGIVGGVGVLRELPVVTSATHGTLAQVTIATFAIAAYMLSPRWQATVPQQLPMATGARRMTLVTVVLLIVQTVVGAIARHSSSEHALWTHVANAFVVFFVVLVAASLAAGKMAAVPGVPALARRLMGLLALQIVLGFAALLVRMGKHPENIEHLWRASLISTHVLVGALLTLVATLLMAHVWRGTRATGGGNA